MGVKVKALLVVAVPGRRDADEAFGASVKAVEVEGADAADAGRKLSMLAKIEQRTRRELGGEKGCLVRYVTGEIINAAELK